MNLNINNHLAQHLLKAALFCAVLALPMAFMKDYALMQLTMVLVYAMALMGVVLLTGYGGQISLGHGAFFAIGAYCAAIMMGRWNFPYWATIVPSGLVCFAVGWLIGLPALRLPGHHLALATFAFAMAVPQLIRYKGVEGWTKGVQGIVLDRPNVPWGLPLSADQWLFTCTFLLCGFMFWVARGIARGRVGRAMLAIRENPTAAAAMGIDIARTQSITFGVSTLFAGVAGAAAAIVLQFVAPDSFTVFFSITLLVGAVVGGLSSLPAAFAGALAIQYLPVLTEQISKSAPTAIYGTLLIVFMFVIPSGVAGLMTKLRRKWDLRRSA